jgi:hypothetical protein
MKYTQRQPPMSKDSKLNPKVHPIWRGVGFALMILAPLMAYAATELFLEANASANYIQFPKDLIVQWQDPLILVKVLMTLFLTLVFMIVLQFIYFIIMRLVAPPRYGPLDVPPVTYKGKPYKR